MTAFIDAVDLRVAVAEHVQNRNISDKYPQLLKAAEAFLNKEIRCREMETSAVVVFTAGVGTLPTGFIEAQLLKDAGGNYYRPADMRYADGSFEKFNVTGSTITLFNASGNYTLYYYASLPTLSASTTANNWLLQKSPNVYLYAVGYEAAKWLRDVELATATRALLEDELRDLNRAEVRAKWGNAVMTNEGAMP